MEWCWCLLCCTNNRHLHVINTLTSNNAIKSMRMIEIPKKNQVLGNLEHMFPSHVTSFRWRTVQNSGFSESWKSGANLQLKHVALQNFIRISSHEKKKSATFLVLDANGFPTFKHLGPRKRVGWHVLFTICSWEPTSAGMAYFKVSTPNPEWSSMQGTCEDYERAWRSARPKGADPTGGLEPGFWVLGVYNNRTWPVGLVSEVGDSELNSQLWFQFYLIVSFPRIRPIVLDCSVVVNCNRFRAVRGSKYLFSIEASSVSRPYPTAIL